MNDGTYQLSNFLEKLTLLFILLKLMPGNTVSNWSWWLVFSPVLIPLFAFLIMVLCIMLYNFVMNFGKNK